MKHYTIEKNVRLLVALLKQYGIKKVVASPGTVNISFVGSLQSDDFFEMYSCVDERSAAYIACGLAAESGEPVVITCTGATASRNYLSGLTEAYYRRLPVIAVTATPSLTWTGHNIAQFIDRSTIQNDVAINSYTLQNISNDDDDWDVKIKINRGLMDCIRKEGGPVHFNLVSLNSYDFSVKELPAIHRIDRISSHDIFPNINQEKIAVFISSHKKIKKELEEKIEDFCYSNDSCVICDHTSGYYGKYKLLTSIHACQENPDLKDFNFDIIIHMGGVSGDYYSERIFRNAKEIWRISPDGQIRDPYKRVTKVFDMEETEFFDQFINRGSNSITLYNQCAEYINDVRSKIPSDIPFSNIWIASKLSSRIPGDSVVHLGILNTLRSWNFFDVPSGVETYSNVGGFGIDGGLSTLLGASFVHSEKLYFGFLGDLAFLYDINSLANRHVGNNLRILLINNGVGIEFKNHTHPASLWEKDANLYMAAGGHMGNKSLNLVKDYTQNLGFEYISASSKEEFEQVMNLFLGKESAKSIVFEVFTNEDEEAEALDTIMKIIKDPSVKHQIREFIKKSLPSEFKNLLKK